MGRADGRQPAGVQGWIELFRSLGQALFEVLRAEARALGEDFRRSGAELARGLALLGGAAALGFWTLGALVLTLIAVLAIWLPPWAAALIVTALFAGAAGLLALLGIRRLQRFESPAESIRQRVSDHLDWWNHRLLAEPVAARLAGGCTSTTERPAAQAESASPSRSETPIARQRAAKPLSSRDMRHPPKCLPAAPCSAAIRGILN